jgi:hypothetical protein
MQSSEPFKISLTVCRKSVKDWTETRIIVNGTQTGKGIHTRTFCQKNQKQLRWVIGQFTGYCHLLGHVFKLAERHESYASVRP